MEDVDASALLRQYVENQSDEAFADLVKHHVNLVYSESARDEHGRNMQFTKVKGVNNHEGQWMYAFALNKPVPAGRKYFLEMEGGMDGIHGKVIERTGESGAYKLDIGIQMGFDQAIHRHDVYRLPLGAVLLEKNSTNCLVTTNGERIEIKFDKRVPPEADLQYQFKYQVVEANKL